LDQYYPKDKASIKRIENVDSSSSSSSRSRNLQPHRVFLNAFRRESIEEIDKELQRWTLSQIREEI